MFAGTIDLPQRMRASAVVNATWTGVSPFTTAKVRIVEQLGEACVVGCPGLAADAVARQAEIAGHVIREGDWLSIDGESGEVFLGERRIVTSRPEAEIAEIERWKRRGASS